MKKNFSSQVSKTQYVVDPARCMKNNVNNEVAGFEINRFSSPSSAQKRIKSRPSESALAVTSILHVGSLALNNRSNCVITGLYT